LRAGTPSGAGAVTEVKRELTPALNTFHLWGIAVGLVISGEYFGWSYGWGEAGTLGFLFATLAVTVLYACFIFSYTELTTAIPHAGGPFAYAHRAFGPVGGLIAGFATLVEFLFAPPAIALALGAYINVWFPDTPALLIALGAYVVFVALNVMGVRQAANFELVVTLLAVAELLVFMGVVMPGFSWTHFKANNEGFGISGILASLPFAIWFYLAIEGVAMAAEETENPRRTIPIAYISGIGTLVVLAFGVMLFAGGVGDWRELTKMDSPLPAAMAKVVGSQSGWLKMLVGIGLFGLLASFHGIILGYSRQIFALARAGYLPAVLAAVHPRFRTPHWALIAGGVIGAIALFSGKTAELITLSALGAIVLYVVSMASLFKLRMSEPALARPYHAPLYPMLPALAFVLALGAGVVMIWLNPVISAIFAALLALAFGYFRLTPAQRASAAHDVLLAGENPHRG
jgi:ethanolamine permease